MHKLRIAVLLTCYNRRKKTLTSLNALFAAELPENYDIEVFLVDDGSTDATGKVVKEHFPQVNIIQGTGNLFWAGGMNLAWKEALKQDYDSYLLLNDDTILFNHSIIELIKTHEYCLKEFRQGGIYIGSTKDPLTNHFSYGGHKIINKYSGRSISLTPNGKIQKCDFANSNIMLVSKHVVETIGILDNIFTHAIADYDYTLRTTRKNIPVLVCSSYIGYCENDHGKNWLSTNYSLKERIRYLKSPKYLAYNEYLKYIKRHFPLYLPIIYIKLWAKTLFPQIWENFKSKNK